MSRLSWFPENSEVREMIGMFYRKRVEDLVNITMSERRSCFMSLRTHKGAVDPAHIITPFGIQVGMFALSTMVVGDLSSKSARLLTKDSG